MATLKVPVTDEDHIQGDNNAPITLIEYGDYQCPFCGAAYPIVKQLQKHFGPQMRFVFRNFPLTEIHAYAETAAIAAEFAGTHDRFWEMHDAIYEKQEMLSPELLFQLTKQLKLSPKELEQAILNNTFESKIRKDFIGGVRSGVNGTPTFFINEHRYTGPVDFATMVEAIESVYV